MKTPKPRACGPPPARLPDIVHKIDPDEVCSAGTPLQARARSFVRQVITPTVAAAAETYPELSIAQILALCEPALARELAFELEHVGKPSARRSPARGQEPVMTSVGPQPAAETACASVIRTWFGDFL